MNKCIASLFSARCPNRPIGSRIHHLGKYHDANAPYEWHRPPTFYDRSSNRQWHTLTIARYPFDSAPMLYLYICAHCVCVKARSKKNNNKQIELINWHGLRLIECRFLCKITYHHCWWHYRWIWRQYRNISKYRCWDDQSLESPCIVWSAYHDNIDGPYQLDRIGCLRPYSARVWCPSIAGTFYSLLMLCILNSFIFHILIIIIFCLCVVDVLVLGQKVVHLKWRAYLRIAHI